MQRRDFLKAMLVGTGIGSGLTGGMFLSFPEIGEWIASYLIDNKLENINDLKEWSKLNKPLSIRVKGRRDIYRGIIFPLFKMKEIEEIKFYSTSLLWGHETFGEDLIINEACQIVNQIKNIAPKTIQIITSTPSINKLYEKYNNILIKSMRNIEKALHASNIQNQIKFGKFHFTSYWMLIKLYNNEFYDIYFFNSPQQSYIVKFDGKIYISPLSSEEYRIRSQVFDQQLIESIPFNKIIEELKMVALCK